MTDYIHGATTSHEVKRLEHMAVFTAHFVFSNLNVHPGQRVLDLACGVGAMTQQIADRCPGIHLFGADIQMGSLRLAKVNHPSAAYAQADGSLLPFADNVFDFVHCSWLLEHVPSPVKVLNEIFRVLKKGGQCQVIEVENSSFRVYPEYPEVVEVMETLCETQTETEAGDPYIGRRLESLFLEAGFTDIEAYP